MFILKLQVWFGLLSLLAEVLLKPDNSDRIQFNFQQHDYEIKFERAEAARYNKDFGQLQVATFKFNRTCTAFNLSATLKVDLGNMLEVIVQAYRFASNEYRLFPLRFEVNACEAISKNYFGFGGFDKCGNFTGCPLMKGKRYHICNFTPDPSQFPPLIPSGRYMIELQLLYLATEVGVIRGYIEVYRPFTGK